MNALAPADLAHVQTAQGLMQDNQPDAARLALARIAPESRLHPDVLEISWELSAQAGEWESALETARTMAAQASRDPAHALLCLACSLTELGRTREALDTLTDAHAQFPESPAIAFNLACCSCKLGQFTEAKQWLNQAMATGGRAEVKLMALSDPDLEPLVDFLCSH